MKPVPTFSVPGIVYVSQQLHGVRTTSSLFAVPQGNPLWPHMPTDKFTYRRTEGFLLVGTLQESDRGLDNIMASAPIQIRYLHDEIIKRAPR
jgi:hypothetical protein